VKYAGFCLRVGASILDSIVLLPLVWIGITNMTQYKSIAIAIIIQTISFLYKPLMEGFKGATLGKMVYTIQVVDSKMNNISLQDSFLRNIPWFGSYIIGLATSIYFFTATGFNGMNSFMDIGIAMQDSSLNTINQIYNLIFLIIGITVAANIRKQGLHDKIANTFCIIK
jgi:uncharacterized RDD family membrane protein YckC